MLLLLLKAIVRAKRSDSLLGAGLVRLPRNRGRRTRVHSGLIVPKSTVSLLARVLGRLLDRLFSRVLSCGRLKPGQLPKCLLCRVDDRVPTVLFGVFKDLPLHSEVIGAHALNTSRTWEWADS